MGGVRTWGGKEDMVLSLGFNDFICSMCVCVCVRARAHACVRVCA